ncbi:cobalamin B12-binding domain-containing protein [Mycolicibacterium psychrotolerans]|uniref:Cobalamin-binding protein n=2 Tax=Mycolicibacterium psychrotolerans TaxID=216929 RepID=A0A7I7M6E1_9MYCO|nr:cobalamin-dependent protein [Mycolicibacterium psychrotolerans]BBX67580.1 cobalamin-binding protein [Mycolicibacterium psychrotolerans]
MSTTEQLWAAIIDGDEYAAVAAVFAAADAGTPCEEILLDVIAPVQHRVGAEWAANRITVAQEHVATAINDRVIAALAQHPAYRPSAPVGRVTVACVDGEWHALPARLLAEVLRLRGWLVDFLGAQVPTPHLIAHLHQSGPDAVALSCMIPTRLPTAHAAITACQAAGVPVLAGGAAFGRDGRFARLLGADGWAPDARAAAAHLQQGMPRHAAGRPHQPIDDLPHLADQEYTMVSATAGQLVKATIADLEQQFPAMRDYTDAQRQHTTEDIAHTVDFLATALYTDDDALFVDFVTWTADILTARGVPSASLHPALHSLATQLSEFPRAQRLLAAARSALRPAPIDEAASA